ncbi:MAG: TAXI family TRAP transporter solute-binding subunit [Frankia sp.]
MAVSGEGLTVAQRLAIGGIVVFTAAAGITAGSGALSFRSHHTELSRCHTVTVQGATAGTPYSQMAEAIAGQLREADQHWTVKVLTSTGSVKNLDSLRSSSAVCTIAIAQLNVTADAYLGAGRYSSSAPYVQPAEKPISELRTIGPLFDDAVHLVTEGASGINSLYDLCGKRVEMGAPGSGTQEVSNLLFNVTELRQRCGPARKVQESSHEFNDAISALNTGAADAMIWSSAAPAVDLQQAIQNGHHLRFVPLLSLQDGLQSNFVSVFSRLSHRSPSPWTFFHATELKYDGADSAATIGIPNGLVSRWDADPALVRFVADLIARPGKKFLAGLATVGFPLSSTPLAGARALADDPAFCLVPLQEDAARYYAERKIEVGACDVS